MSKIELDDQILDHPKFVRAVKVGGSEAVFLWLGLRAYCAKLLTDGFVPDDMLDEVRGPKDSRKRKSALDALKLVNLVEECDGGVRLHDYLDWASSHDDVMRWRAKAKERQAKSRAMSQRDSQRYTPCDSQRDDGVSHVASVRARVAPPSPSPSPSPTTTQSAASAADPQPPQPRQDSRRERSRTDLSELPINELASRWRENPTWVAESSPQSRPELVAAARAWDEAVGLAPRVLGHPGRDGGTRALLELYADGVTNADVLRACAQAKHDDWICGRAPGRPGDAPRKRRIDCLSQAVLRRLLDAADEHRPAEDTPAMRRVREALAAVEVSHG